MLCITKVGEENGGNNEIKERIGKQNGIRIHHREFPPRGYDPSEPRKGEACRSRGRRAGGGGLYPRGQRSPSPPSLPSPPPPPPRTPTRIASINSHVDPTARLHITTSSTAFYFLIRQSRGALSHGAKYKTWSCSSPSPLPHPLKSPAFPSRNN